jgi:hypothetical protein
VDKTSGKSSMFCSRSLAKWQFRKLKLEQIS